MAADNISPTPFIQGHIRKQCQVSMFSGYIVYLHIDISTWTQIYMMLIKYKMFTPVMFINNAEG